MNQRALLFSACGLVAIGIAAGFFAFMPPLPSEPPPSATTQNAAPPARTAAMIRQEIEANKAQYRTLNRQLLLTTADRQTIDKTTLIPLLRQQLALCKELETLAPSTGELEDVQLMLLVLGDATTSAEVDAEAAAATPNALYAGAMRSLADFLMNDTDAEQQVRAIDRFFQTIKSASDPSDHKLVSYIRFFAKVPYATPAVREHLAQRVSESVAEPTRTQVLERLAKNAAAS